MVPELPWQSATLGQDSICRPNVPGTLVADLWANFVFLPNVLQKYLHIIKYVFDCCLIILAGVIYLIIIEFRVYCIPSITTIILQ